jgi:hypothetical protein
MSVFTSNFLLMLKNDFAGSETFVRITFVRMRFGRMTFVRITFVRLTLSRRIYNIYENDTHPESI